MKGTTEIMQGVVQLRYDLRTGDDDNPGLEVTS